MNTKQPRGGKTRSDFLEFRRKEINIDEYNVKADFWVIWEAFTMDNK